jgi:DNA-binding transcriptional ArsR family regulator
LLLRLFSSETRVELLTLFFSRPEERFYTRQLARELGRDISGIKRELDNLEKAGLVSSEKVGNLRYYSVNKASPLYPELKAIIAKTAGVENAIRKALARVEGIRFAFIYSTHLRPLEGMGAIELLIVGQVDLGHVNEVITGLERRLSREINYLVFDESEFRRRKAEDDPFLSEVLKGKRTVLIGTEDGL